MSITRPHVPQTYIQRVGTLPINHVLTTTRVLLLIRSAHGAGTYKTGHGRN